MMSYAENCKISFPDKYSGSMNLFMATDDVLGIKVRPALLLLYQHTHFIDLYLLQYDRMYGHGKNMPRNGGLTGTSQPDLGTGG